MQVEEAIGFVNWMEAQRLLGHVEQPYKCTHPRANRYDGIWKGKDGFIAYGITCLDCKSSSVYNSDKPVPVTEGLEKLCKDYNEGRTK